MQPIHKLALRVTGLGALLCLGFFFHVIAFLVVLFLFIYEVDRFRFVYMNTQGDAYESEYYQPVIPGVDGYPSIKYDGVEVPWGRSYYRTSVGSDGQRGLRADLSEGEE